MDTAEDGAEDGAVAAAPLDALVPAGFHVALVRALLRHCGGGGSGSGGGPPLEALVWLPGSGAGALRPMCVPLVAQLAVRAATAAWLAEAEQPLAPAGAGSRPRYRPLAHPMADGTRAFLETAGGQLLAHPVAVSLHKALQCPAVAVAEAVAVLGALPEVARAAQVVANCEAVEAVGRMAALVVEARRLARLVVAGGGGGGPLPSALFDSDLYAATAATYLVAALQRVGSGMVALETAVQAALATAGGHTLLTWILLNVQGAFQPVVAALVATSRQPKLTPWFRQRLAEALTACCALRPRDSRKTRRTLLAARAFPAIVLRLTSLVCRDEVVFLNSLLGDPSGPFVWLVQSFAAEQSRGMLDTLTSKLCRDMLSSAQDLERCLVMKIMCATFAQSSLTLHEGQAKEWLASLAAVLGKLRPSPSSARFLKMALCFLLVCPGMSTEAAQPGVVAWLRSLTQLIPAFDTTTSFAEMLLLLSVHFHGDSLSAVADLIRATLGFQLQVPTESLRRMRGIFNEHVFALEAVARQAISVPVTHAVSGASTSFLPLHCVHFLLKDRVFLKHRLDPSAWIYRQVLQADAQGPIHPYLPALLQAVAQVAVDPVIGAQRTLGPVSSNVELYTSAQLLQAIQGTNRVVQALFFLYAMQANAFALAKLARDPSGASQELPYPDTFFEQVPIKTLLVFMAQNRDQFDVIHAPLMSFTAAQFPHTFWIADLLVDEALLEERAYTHDLDNEHADSHAGGGRSSGAPLVALLQDLKAAPGLALAALTRLMALTPSALEAHFDLLLSIVLPQLVAAPQHGLLDVFRTLWLALNTVRPRRLWMATIAAFGIPGVGAHSEVAKNPLCLFECAPAVLQEPQLLEMLFAMVKVYLIHSQALASRQLQFSRDREQTQTLVNSLILTQQSTVVQMAFEVCARSMPRPAADAPAGAEPTVEQRTIGKHQAVCKVVGAFVHQLFIADPMVTKIVHFQGYAAELLPVAAAYVPSMHVCLDFIPELLGHEAFEKQVFGMQLAGALAPYYPLPKTLEIARDVLGRLQLAAQMERSTRTRTCDAALPVVVQLCAAFPLLVEAAVAVLLKLRGAESKGKGSALLADGDRGVVGEKIDAAFRALVKLMTAPMV